MTEREVQQSARTHYLEGLAARRRKAAAAGANFWVFEKTDAASTFLEFVEAGSTDVLQFAVTQVEEPGTEAFHASPVWREVNGV